MLFLFLNTTVFWYSSPSYLAAVWTSVALVSSVSHSSPVTTSISVSLHFFFFSLRFYLPIILILSHSRSSPSKEVMAAHGDGLYIPKDSLMFSSKLINFRKGLKLVQIGPHVYFGPSTGANRLCVNPCVQRDKVHYRKQLGCWASLETQGNSSVLTLISLFYPMATLAINFIKS